MTVGDFLGIYHLRGFGRRAAIGASRVLLGAVNLLSEHVWEHWGLDPGRDQDPDDSMTGVNHREEKYNCLFISGTVTCAEMCTIYIAQFMRGLNSLNNDTSQARTVYSHLFTCAHIFTRQLEIDEPEWQCSV